MKKIAVGLATLLFVSCGSSSSKNINGTWQANLLNPDKSMAYVFFTALSQGTGSTVDVNSLNFNIAVACFGGPLGPSATFSATGSSNGYQTGPFQMTVENNAIPIATSAILGLNGNRNSDGSISGTWSVTSSSGCAGSGSFTMSIHSPMGAPIY